MAYNYRNYSVPLIPRSETAGIRSSTTFPQFVVYHNSDQTLSSDAKVSFNSITLDSGDLWSTSNNRFTAPVRGVYSLSWLITMQFNGTMTYNATYIRVNNGSTRFRSRTSGSGSGIWSAFTGHAAIDLSEGDYVEIFAYTQASTMNLQSNETTFWGHLLGPHT